MLLSFLIKEVSFRFCYCFILFLVLIVFFLFNVEEIITFLIVQLEIYFESKNENKNNEYLTYLDKKFAVSSIDNLSDIEYLFTLYVSLLVILPILLKEILFFSSSIITKSLFCFIKEVFYLFCILFYIINYFLLFYCTSLIFYINDNLDENESILMFVIHYDLDIVSYIKFLISFNIKCNLFFFYYFFHYFFEKKNKIFKNLTLFFFIYLFRDFGINLIFIILIFDLFFKKYHRLLKLLNYGI